MKIALIGTSQSGKTTAFLALAGPQSPHLLADQKPHLAMLDVPDERLEALADSVHSKKKTALKIGLVDSPLLLAHPNRGLDFNQIRDADGFALTLRAFDDGDDPVKGFQAMTGELVLKDLEVAEQAVKKIEEEMKKGRKEREKELPVLEKCRDSLREERPLRSLPLTPEEKKAIGAYGFLSLKPLLAVVNLSEKAIGEPPPSADFFDKNSVPWFSFSAETEKELFELDESEREAFMKELGVKEPARAQFVRLALQTLGLVTFFTLVGEEARAWALEKGKTVLEAAGKIHTDMARGFIKAEVFSYQDFKTHSSVQALKEKGLLRLEGKEYLVRDGDVLNIKFSV